MEETREQRKSGLSNIWAVREVDHLFSRLSRYTRFVVYSKWSLAGFALVLLVALVVWPMLSTDRSGMRVSFIGTEQIPGKSSVSPTMDNPVYEGSDKNGRQYKITGLKAIQANSDMIVVEQVEGQLVGGTSFVNLSADRAEYNQKEQRIELQGNVHVLNDEGYSFTTPTATIDTATMMVTGQQQIVGEGPMGKLLATGFEIGDNGTKVKFGGTGRVNMVIDKAKDPS